MADDKVEIHTNGVTVTVNTAHGSLKLTYDRSGDTVTGYLNEGDYAPLIAALQKMHAAQYPEGWDR